MPTHFITADSIGAGVRIDLLAIYDCYVAAGVRVVSSDVNGIIGTGISTAVTVAGEVAAQYFGIFLTEGLGVRVQIQQGGSVTSMASSYYNAAIWLESADALVVNHGTLSGQAHAVMIDGDNALFVNHGTVTSFGEDYDFGAVDMFSQENFLDSKSWFINYGTVTANRTAYCGDSDYVDQVENYGTITGRLYLLGGEDFLLNRGTINGEVLMGDGNDVLDTSHGAVLSQIELGAGNDVFYGSSAEGELVVAGDGIDSVEFRGNIAVELALDASFDAAGAAVGDSLYGFENIYGSMQGDHLRGDGAANYFSGRGGVDTLEGGLGADTLRGGNGADVLTGDDGNDNFRFSLRSEAGDSITDFHNANGDNDRFMISAAGFGGGLVAGVLAASQFRARADNLAQDGNDRFIFRTTDRTVWFDVDGAGGQGPVMLADLQAGATLTAVDFLIV